MFQRDINLQQLVFHWLRNILDEMPKGKSDYDKWIQDGKIIVKGIIKQYNKLVESVNVLIPGLKYKLSFVFHMNFLSMATENTYDFDLTESRLSIIL